MYTGYVTIEVDKIEAINTRYNSNQIDLEVQNLDLHSLLVQYPVEDIIRAIGYDTLLENIDEDDIVEWLSER